MSDNTLNVVLTEDQQLAYDKLLYYIFVTAIEGGINYWCDINSYKHSDESGNDKLHDFEAVICEVEPSVSSSGVAKYIINRDTIEKGYLLATESDFLETSHWSVELPPSRKMFSKELVDLDYLWDFDAGDADLIIQLALFNEIIFG
jgi:hypothetical protein